MAFSCVAPSMRPVAKKKDGLDGHVAKVAENSGDGDRSILWASVKGSPKESKDIKKNRKNINTYSHWAIYRAN